MDNIENIKFFLGDLKASNYNLSFIKDVENLIKENKELKEYKKIAELTKISCCTAQNCEALNNAIKNGLENEKLLQENKELKEHLQKYYNGELFTAKQLKNIEENQRKYFIHKSKLKEKIEELENCLQMAKQIMTADISEDFDCMKLKEFKEYLLNEMKLNENFEE